MILKKEFMVNTRMINSAMPLDREKNDVNSIKVIFFKIILALVAFVYLFNPRFVALELRKVIDVVSLISVIIYHWHNPMIKKNHVFKNVNILVMFFIYLGLGTIIFILSDIGKRNIYLNNIYEVSSSFFRCFITSKAFIIFMKKYKFGWEDLTDVLALTGTIQLACVLAAFFNPSIKSTFNSFTIANSRSSYIAFSTKYNEYRSYGLAENLFDSFGYTISLIIIITFISGLYSGNNKRIILSFLMLAMPLLNARTGIVLALLGLSIAFLIYSKSSVEHIIKILFLLIPCLLIGSYFIKYLPESTREWITEGTSSISDLLFNHNKSGVFLTLSNQFIFPDEIIFGAFGSPESHGVGHSDVGYIQCVWKYGVVGSTLLIIGFLKSIISTSRMCQNEQLNTFSICVVSLLIIYLYKMYPFVNFGSNFIIFTSLMAGGIGVAEKRTRYKTTGVNNNNDI